MTTCTDRLRHDVMSGRLAPGSRLVEMQLAEQYGTSRAAVRSAIAELEKEGLVDRAANRGATVRRLSGHEAVLITEARCLLEVFMAERAARLATPAERLELDDIAAQMHDAVTSGALDRYSELNRLLHQRIRQIGRHDVIAGLIEGLRNRAATFDIRLAVIPGRAERSLEEHRVLVRAIVEGDDEGAGQAARRHIESVIDALQVWRQIAG